MMMEINRYIDHTVLKPTTTLEDVKQLCMQCVEYDLRPPVCPRYM